METKLTAERPTPLPTTVSVLLPTRGRPEWLKESVMSLWSQAAHPNALELILKVDEDDEPTRKMVEELATLGIRIILWCSPSL